NATTAKMEPSNQVTNFAKGTVTTSAIPLTWTAALAGSQLPDGYLVKLNTGTVVDPVDGTDPADVTAITSGAANTKVTPGSATSATSFTGMTAGTMYNYKIYSYTNSGTLIDFNTTSVPAINVATLPNPVTGIALTATGTTTANITWTAASGYNSGNHTTLVFVKSTSAITVGTPTNAPSTYTANTAFLSGTPYQGDAAAYCVFNGDGTSIAITGLSASTTYYILVYTVVDASNSDGTNSYSSGATANGTTVYNVPWTENFDAMSTIGIGYFPAGWLATTPSGTPWATGNAASFSYNDPYSAPNYLGCYYSPYSSDKYIITPGFSLTSGTSYDFSFRFAGDGYSGWGADARYNTTQTGTGSTILGAAFISSGTTSSTTYTPVTRTFVAPSSGIFYFIIHVNNTSSPYGYLGLDNFSLAVTPTCFVPTAVTSSAVTTTTATISWTAASPAPSGGYQYEVRTSGAAGSGSSGLTASGTTGAGVVTKDLTGLSAGTAYSVYVRSFCGGSDYSSWTSEYIFTTLCATITSYPYTMGFDGSANCWTVSTGTAIWALGSSSSDISAPQSGTGFAYKPYTTSTQYLFSPPVDLSFFGSNTARLNFWIYRHAGTVLADQISFKVNTSATSTGATNLQTFPILTTSVPTVPSSGWYNYTIDIPTSWNSAGTIYFVIEGKTTAGYSSYDIGLDNFTIEALPAPTITSLGSTSGCVGSSLTINGTNLTGATAANVKIGGTAVSSITSNTGTVMIVVVGSGTTGTVSVTTSGGTAISSATFTVIQLPVLFTVGGGGAYCAGGSGVSITLSGSESGVDYALSTSPVTTLTGIGSALTFGPAAFAAGTYTITATNTTTSCSVLMTGTATVTVNPLPSAVTIAPTSATITAGAV
ncbi:MAG: fibronectin type III domain-containing protein, partial [Bacteroidota bacterium]